MAKPKLNSKSKSKSKRTRRTRETGLAIGLAEKPQTSRAAKRQNKPRKDSIVPMLQICPYGWEYDEDIALQKGTAEAGYYLHETIMVDITPEDAFEIHVHRNDARGRTFCPDPSCNLPKFSVPPVR